MKDKIIKYGIIAVIAFALLAPIVTDMVENSVVKTLKFEDFNAVLNNTGNYKFALVHVASGKSEQSKEISEKLKEAFSNKFTSDDDFKYYFMDKDSLSYQDLTDLEITYNGDSYIFISNQEVIKVLSSADVNLDTVLSYVDEYGYVGISESVKNYKVAEDAKTYLALVKKKNTVTMAVFGRDTCYYCNKFKPVYNTVAEENNLDVYYFDSDSYDKDEYDKIMKAGLKIPAACSDTEEETNLGDGFSTPLTLFTKNGKVVDCISGYVNKQTLETKLTTLGLISQGE